MLLRPLVRPLLRPLLRSPGDLIWGGFSPASLFAAGEQGAWLEASDLSALFQDATGTTTVTDVEQPAGLWLDGSRGLALGAEALAQGPSGFTVTTGWQGSGASLSVVSNRLRVTATQTGGVGSVAPGTFSDSGVGHYLCSMRVSSRTAGATGAHVYFRGEFVSLPADGQTYTARPRASNNTEALAVFFTAASIGDYIEIEMASVRPLLGNHAIQSTDASRFITKAGGSLALDGVNDFITQAAGGGATAGLFLCAAVTVSGGAGAARTIWSDTGASTGYRVRVNASNQLELAAGNGTAFTTAATTATLPVGETHVVTAWDDGVNLRVQIDQGAVASVARPAVAAGTASVTIGRDNGAASSHFNGRLFVAVHLQTAPSAALIAQTQRYAASRAGVVLA